ncbi:MAG TPA: accessory factor UbiK family protein [Stellaceae bacterium]|nr:accessory factor UbiK family protein [Stellaceae bacterium]
MQSENRLFDDLARVATGALGALSGVRDEVETRLRDQMERILARMNLVRREEFDAVQAMAAKARAEQEVMERRIAALEAHIEGHAGPARPVRVRKPKPASSL